MCVLRLLVILLFYFCVTEAQSNTEEENLIVNTNSGKVRGRLRQTIDAKKIYYSFQGIPYAEPPIENLRFRSPVPVKNWEGILETDEDEHKCVQEYEAVGSENCLYINVFTPKINESNLPALPVMVWIYGGAFYGGSSKISIYSPDYFLEQEVVVVTFNYRLGIFGFLSTEDTASPGNYGLKDQILALKWVRANIRYFGGDSKNVTVFGQSAGSASVSYLIQTRLAKDLFQKAIMQSGTSLNLWALSRFAKETAFAIGRYLDIHTENSTVLVNSLRRIETKTLQAAATSSQELGTLITNPRSGLIFGPTIEPAVTDAVIRKKSHEMLNYGDFNSVPCMVGFTSNEGLPIKSIIDYVQPYIFTYDLFSTRLVPIDMNIKSNLQISFVGSLIRQKYFGFIPIALSRDNVVKFVTDDQFVRPMHEYVSLVSKYTPVYFYRFSYEGILGTDGQRRNGTGVGHSEDLSYLWKQEDNLQYPPKDDLVIRKRLIKLWTNFAKTGNPTPERDVLLQNVTWPTSTFRNITYLDIGQNLKVSSNFDSYNIQFWKKLYRINGEPPYDTY